ncbi:MAG: methyltransferase domain-containing protein [Peptococcaceae bacterium]|nr:methyltransferase domain-containing protein [Peptococcaceae bacterium]
MSRGLDNVVHLVQHFLSPSVQNGGTVIDATAGRGHDTLYLAGLVGPSGRVFSFDVQEDALQSTRSLLEGAGVADRVTLVKDCHGNMEHYVSGPVDSVIFNLGYLPGGEHSVITEPASTVRALQAALGLLRPAGRVGMVIYPGHPGGREEYEAVEKICSSLDKTLFNALKIGLLNRAATAPVVIIIEKADVR